MSGGYYGRTMVCRTPQIAETLAGKSGLEPKKASREAGTFFLMGQEVDPALSLGISWG
jgi:hypothetical protein